MMSGLNAGPLQWVNGASLTVTVCSRDHIYCWRGLLPTAPVHHGSLIAGPAADVSDGRLTLKIHRDAESLTLQCEAVLDEPVLSIKVSFGGVPRGDVVTPPGAVWATPTDTALCFAYPDGSLPGRWRGGESGTAPATGALPGITSQVLCIEAAEGVFAIHSLDEERRFKRFWVRPAGELTVLEVLEEAAAHAPQAQMGMTLRMLTADTALDAMRTYILWAAPVFGLSSLDEREDVPGWLRTISLVVACHGVSSDERICNTYADMEAHLETLATEVDPKRTLVRLVGWEGRVDHHLPDNTASDLLGGAQALRSLVRTAHRLGSRVALHFNIWGLAYGHPQFEDLARHAIVDRYGRSVGWEVDYNHDEVLEPVFLYASPDALGFRVQLIGAVRRAIAEFDPDLIHLDQTAFPVNDARHDHQRGIDTVFAQLRALEPEVVLIGEGFNEWTASLYAVCEGLSQIWPGMNIRPELFRELFGKYVRPYAHSASLPPTPHPGVWTYPPVDQWWSEQRRAQQEQFFADLETIPTLILTTPRADPKSPSVRVVLDRARRLAQKQI